MKKMAKANQRASGKTAVKLLHSSESLHYKTHHLVHARQVAAATEGGYERTQEKGKEVDAVKTLRLQEEKGMGDGNIKRKQD